MIEEAVTIETPAIPIDTPHALAGPENRAVTTLAEQLKTARIAFLDTSYDDPKKDQTMVEYNRAGIAFSEGLTAPLGKYGLAPRLVTGRLHTPPCAEDGMDPRRFATLHHRSDRLFNSSFIPWIPDAADTSFFQDEKNCAPLERLVVTDLDRMVVDMMSDELERIRMTPQAWISWCESKRVWGIEVPTADYRAWRVKNFLITADEGGKKQINLPTPQELRSLERDNYYHISPTGGEEVIQREYDLLSFARWDIDEGLGLYPVSANDFAGRTRLEERYHDLLAALELNYYKDGPPKADLMRLSQSYTGLVMGGRVEMHKMDYYFVTDKLMLDYFDVVMLLSQELEFDPHNFEKNQYHSDSLKTYPPRCLFGDHNSAGDNPKGVLMTMASMYFRMDPKQREFYKDYITSAFQKAEEHNKRFGSHFPRMLRVPGTSTFQPPDPDMPLYNGVNGVISVVSAAHYLHMSTADELVLRERQDAEGRVSFHGNDLPITGHRADEFVIDDKGNFVHRPGYSSSEVVDISQLRLSLTTAERMGKETALKVAEVLRDPKAGDPEALSSLTSLMELLLGKEGANRELSDILLFLGRIENQTELLRTAERGEIENVLASLTDKPDFKNAGRLSQLMMIYEIFGFLPKELVAERILSCSQAAEPLFAVQFALMLENMRKADLADQGLDVKEYVSPVFRARENIREARAANPSLSPARLKLTIEHELANILSSFNTYCQYDLTMDNALGSFLVGKKTGSLYSMCEPQAETMAALADYVDWNLHAYPSYREIGVGIPLDDWFAMIEVNNSVLPHEHVLAQVDFTDEEGSLDVIMLDATTGHILVTNQVRVDKEKTAATSGSRIDYYPRIRRPELNQTPDWGGIGYGARDRTQVSPILAHLAAEFPALRRYVSVFNPDDISLLKQVASSYTYDRSERIAALHKMLKIAPREFGRFQDMDGKRNMVVGLENCTELALSNNDFIPAIFLSNIMASHAAIPRTIKQKALGLRQVALESCGFFSSRLLEDQLVLYREILTEKDREDIRLEWKKYQKSLENARKNRQEDTFVAVTQARLDEEKSRAVEGIQVESLSLPERENEPTDLGVITSAAINTVAEKTARAVTAENVKAVIDANATHLIELKPEVSRKALEWLLDSLADTDRDRLLLVLEVMLLKSEEAYFAGTRGLSDRAWQNLEKAAAANNLALPYTRHDLVRNLGTILKKHRISDSDLVFGLLN